MDHSHWQAMSVEAQVLNEHAKKHDLMAEGHAAMSEVMSEASEAALLLFRQDAQDDESDGSELQ
jgi:hypothetical protein